jgi:hypothetical protein
MSKPKKRKAFSIKEIMDFQQHFWQQQRVSTVQGNT